MRHAATLFVVIIAIAGCRRRPPNTPGMQPGAPIAFAEPSTSELDPTLTIAPPQAPAVTPTAPVTRTGAKAPAPTARPATGLRVHDDANGWAVKTPARWKHGIKDGGVVFGSDSESGLIVLGYVPDVTVEQAEAAIEGQVQALGATLIGRARTHKFKAGRGLVVELSATTSDGTAIRGRGAVIVGPRGALAVLGITTVEKFETLRKRVDAIALSTVFFQPKTPKQPPRGDIAAVAGCFRYSNGTSVWVERTLRFDGQGGVSYNGASAATVEHKDSSGNPIATTSALSEGSPDLGTYSVVGKDEVRIVWGDGSTAAYELVWENGRLGALKSGDSWYLAC